MELKSANFYSDFIRDVIIYFSILVILCLVSAAISRWKEKRRLEKEYKEYEQRRADEEAEER